MFNHAAGEEIGAAIRRARFRPAAAGDGRRVGIGEEGSRPVSRVLSRAIIPLGRPSPDASSSLPGSRARTRRCRIAPATSLFGLAPGGVCHATRCCHLRGALLPHHFTLTSATRLAACRASAVSFCCTFRGLAPPRCYLAPCPSEPGLSSPLLCEKIARNAAITRPAPAGEDTRLCTRPQTCLTLPAQPALRQRRCAASRTAMS